VTIPERGSEGGPPSARAGKSYYQTTWRVVPRVLEKTKASDRGKDLFQEVDEQSRYERLEPRGRQKWGTIGEGAASALQPAGVKIREAWKRENQNAAHSRTMKRYPDFQMKGCRKNIFMETGAGR